MIYAFGDYELDTRGYELRRAGEALPVAPQVLEFLAYLIQHQGQVISKATLLEELWEDRFVTDWALAYCVKVARKAIDDSGRTQRFIKTVHARGYCFIAPVEVRQAGDGGREQAAPPPPVPDATDAEASSSPSQPLRSGTRYALLIGNGHYPHDAHLADLPAPEQDLEALAAVLTEPRIASFQAVQRLPNASHHEVHDALLTLAKAAQKDDLVLVYFAAHIRLDAQGKLYLAALNTRSDQLGDTALAFDAIKAVIDTCQSTRMILIFDCRFSSVTGDPTDPHAVADQMREVASGRGKYILSAAPSAPSNLLTQHLMEGLRTGHADIDRAGTITIDQLYHYACTKASQAAEPPPTKWDLSGKGRLILARTRPVQSSPTASAAVQAHYDAIAQLFKKARSSLA